MACAVIRVDYAVACKTRYGSPGSGIFSLENPRLRCSSPAGDVAFRPRRGSWRNRYQPCVRSAEGLEWSGAGGSAMMSIASIGQYMWNFNTDVLYKNSISNKD